MELQQHIFISLDNLSGDFLKNNEFYYKKIGHKTYLATAWLENVTQGEHYYPLNFLNVNCSHINSFVAVTPTGTNTVKPVTAYIKDNQLYLNVSVRDNFSIFAIIKAN